MLKGLLDLPLPTSRRPLAIAGFLSLGIAATFLLPYFIPAAPSVSDSYLVGFNNRACVLLFLLFSISFVWWTGGFSILSRPMLTVSETPGNSLVLLALLLFSAFLLGEWHLLLHHNAIQEAPYFLDRLQHLAAGEVPYRDFEFAYGPLLLYLPLALARLTGLSLSDAYFVSWILQFLAGVLLIQSCVRPFNTAPRRKNTIFLLLAVSWWAGPICCGPNYTPFRFFLAPFFAVLLAPRLISLLSTPRLVAEVLLAFSLLLATFPEQAVAFLGAALVCLALTLLQTRQPVYLVRLLAISVGSALLLFPLFRFGYFQTASAISHGGYNFPVLPTPQQLPLFILILAGIAALTNAIRQHRAPGPVEFLVVLGLLLLPAAFGRADLGHFLINCTPLTLAGLVLLAPYPKTFRSLVILYVAIVLLLPAPFMLHYILRDQRAAARTVVNHLAPGTSTLPFAPFRYPIPLSPTPDTTLARTGFFFGTENMLTREQILRGIAELDTLHPTRLLLPDRLYCTAVFLPYLLRPVLGTPFIPPARHDSRAFQPLCSYIQQHYAPTPREPAPPDYEIWTIRP